MSNVILTRPEQLPRELADLLGGDFRPELRPTILYIPSNLTPQGIANVAFFLSLTLTIPGLLFLLGQLFAETSVGTGIAALMLVLPATLTGLSWRYRQKAQQRQALMASGEHRMGLWVTPTHLMWRDLERLECVARKEITRLEMYQSGRPPLGIVVVHLHNGQRLRIVAEWLVGWAGKVTELHGMLTERLVLRQALAKPMRALLVQPPREGETRWQALMRGLEQLRVDHHAEWRAFDEQNVRAVVNKLLENWPDREREAEPRWWLQFVSEGTWEYGVNGVGAAVEQFAGFKTLLDWKLPLARYARYEVVGDLACTSEQYRESFLHSLAFADLTQVEFITPIAPQLVENILTSGRFTHLQQLSLPTRDPELTRQLQAWRLQHAIAEVPVPA